MQERAWLIAQHDRDRQEKTVLIAQINQHWDDHYRQFDERGIGYIDYRRMHHEPVCSAAKS